MGRWCSSCNQVGPSGHCPGPSPVSRTFDPLLQPRNQHTYTCFLPVLPRDTWRGLLWLGTGSAHTRDCLVREGFLEEVTFEL